MLSCLAAIWKKHYSPGWKEEEITDSQQQSRGYIWWRRGQYGQQGDAGGNPARLLGSRCTWSHYLTASVVLTNSFHPQWPLLPPHPLTTEKLSHIDKLLEAQWQVKIKWKQQTSISSRDALGSWSSRMCRWIVERGTEAKKCVGSKCFKGNWTIFWDLTQRLLTRWNRFTCMTWK